MYKQSERWDMDISLEELIENNKTCKLDMNSTHHFDTYAGILIYVSHPKKEEKFTIQLGIDESGIMYEGDYGCREDYKEIPIADGLEILMKYGELVTGLLQIDENAKEGKHGLRKSNQHSHRVCNGEPYGE